MAIQGFEYKEFAQNLAQQALELIPPDFNENQKNYVANTLLNFSAIAGQALYDEGQFNIDQAVMITQIIAEWSFHKSVDLVRSGIPQQYWDPIMQKIAFTIFEIAKNAFHQNLPQDQCLQVIEHHVKKTYLDCIAELKDKNMIDEGLLEQASMQSNIDAMVQQQAQQEVPPQEQQPVPQQASPAGMPQQAPVSAPLGADTKVLKLATLAMLFNRLKQDKVQSILNKFSPDDANSVIKFMGMTDLDAKMDTNAVLRCLQEIKTNIPKNQQTLAPNKIIDKIQNVSQYLDRSQIEQTLRLERNKVKKFVFTALEGEYYEIAPKVANIIATHLEDSV